MEAGDTKFIGCSQDVFSPHGQDDFCTRDNWQTAVVYLANELEMFGLASPCTKGEADQTQSSLDVITLVNSSWKLVQMFRSCQGRVQEMEAATRAAAAERDRLATNSSRQREELNHRDRLIAESKEQGRQASEMAESGNVKLKAAKEEIRKLMSVLLQREAKYSHEIRRSEQEMARLKERLVKVLMEKGEGRGLGANLLALSGPVPGARGGRAQWQTGPAGARREEELFRRVIEEMTKREAAAAEINLSLETALSELSSAVRESLTHLEVDPPHSPVVAGEEQMDVRTDLLFNQTRELSKLLRENILKCKKPSESYLSQEKMGLYEEKMKIYEQILVNFESSKEKKDWILQELKSLQKQSKETLLQEKCQIRESREQIERMRSELVEQSENLDKMKTQFIRNHHSIPSSADCPAQFFLAAASPETLPGWAVGPVQVTPSRSLRGGGGGGEVSGSGGSGGLVLGYSARPASRPASRAASRPGSRPGSQPGSRAPSVQRERVEKGRSPAVNLINKRAGGGGGGGRMLDSYTASLGRRARPKSQTISPSRANTTVNRRSAAISRSPSRGKEVQSNRSSLSLPRHSHHQLSLRAAQEKSKRHSGAWSKPPTPGPLSPETSDSEAQTSQQTRSSLLRSSKYSDS